MKTVFFFFLVLSSLYATPTKNIPLEKVSLQLHWKYQFEFAGFIAAKEKGFYKEVGLDVTLKEYTFGTNITQSVLSGESEYGIYNSRTMLDFLQNKPIRLVASYFKRAALVLIAQPNIHSPHDLIDKKIMATTKDDFILNFQPYFEHYDMSVDDVKLVPHSYNIDDFATKKVAAMTAFISDQVYKLDAKGIKYNILNPSDENLFVLQLELFTSNKELQKHPKRVLAFREASKKGWEYALSHQEEIAKIIHEKYAPQISQADLLKEAKGIDRLILPYTYEIGSIDINFLQKQIELFKKYYKIDNHKKISQYIYEKPKNVKDMFTQKELDYIKRNPVINVCLQYDQFPIDGYKDGKMIGIASDLYKIISQKTSLLFNPIVAISRENSDQNIKEKKCELVSLYPTQDKTNPLIKATKSFINTNFTLISKLDKSFIADEKQLKSKILVTQLEDFKKYILTYYPYLTIKVEENRDKMMKMLMNDKVYGVIELDEKADYLIDKYGYAKLKINGFIAKEYPFEESIGVMSNQKVLFSIIQKTLESISEKEIQSIVSSWRLSRYKEVTDYRLLFVLIFVAIIIFSFMMYYQNKLKGFNKRLEKEVLFKTKELREINDNLTQTVDEKIKELVQKDQILTMQSKQAVMGEMISMIAHQWRQPLSTITLQISKIQLEEMMGKKVSKEKFDNLLKDISERIIYLSATINDFKTYFHPERKTSQISLNEIVQKVLTLAIARLEEEHVNVNVECSQEIELDIYANELVQVLLNILNNAIDAYQDIESKEKNIIIKCSSFDNIFEISIEDEANGISEENLKKIFDPYFSTKGKNGTGLGLYMSQMIIQKQFKGSIDVESSTQGTNFKIKACKVLSTVHQN